METLATKIDQMITQLNHFILPSSLMESFDVYREESVAAATHGYSDAQLSWFLEMLNQFRGPDDRKDSLLEVFDPCMFTCEHPARNAAPGTRIEMPALTSEIAQHVGGESEFGLIARDEIDQFRDHATTYSDADLIGLAKIAASALVDPGTTFDGREEAIRYLALNASAALEDLWTTDDELWQKVPARRIQFPDMVAKRKADLLADTSSQPSFDEADLRCFSDEEIRKFAFDIRGLLLTDQVKHLAICMRCQIQLESWTKTVEKFERSAARHCGRADA